MGRRKTKNSDRKKKVALVFDETKRKDFLCGFRKRKLERKKKAQEELQRLLKDELNELKQRYNKESYKKLVVSSRPIPDIEQILQEEYEDEDVNVKIVELSSDTLQKKDLVIGENRPREVVMKKVVKKTKVDTIKGVSGMCSDVESEEAEEPEEDDKDNLKTKKEVKRILKNQATKKIQKSKVFQMKSKLDSAKNKKKSQQKKGRMSAKADPRKDKSRKKNDKTKKKIGRRKHGNKSHS